MKSTLLALMFAAGIALAQPTQLTIVSIGDSYASGEGNPNSFSNGVAHWSSVPCHRSVNNGRRMASDRINDMAGASTTFVDFSCAGAQIDAGLIGSMTSVAPQTPGATITSQIDRVATWQSQHNNQKIDILLISIGGNDVGFGSVVKDCMLPSNCTTGTAVTTAIDRIQNFLPDALGRLDTQIRQRLNVGKIYITEYSNPFLEEDGSFCGDFDDFFTPSGDLLGIAMRFISSQESQFLHNHFLGPLNNTLKTFAGQHTGWRFVAGVHDTFGPHGFCNGADQRWINTLGDSFVRQGDHKGVAHPNTTGHKAYADSIIAQATRDFNLPLENPRLIDIYEFNVGPNLPDGADIALPLVGKQIRAEVGQSAGTLTAQLLFRVRNPIEFQTPAFSTAAMTDAGAGQLTMFQVNIPGSASLLPGQRIEYRVRITATRNGATAITTSGTHSIVLGEILDN